MFSFLISRIFFFPFREQGKLTISSIFDDGPSMNLEYFNNYQISWIKLIMAEKLGCDLDDLTLSYGDTYCEDDTFLFEMNLMSGSGLTYLNSLKYIIPCRWSI